MLPDRPTARVFGTNLSRRSFLSASAAVGGGLMLGMSLPLGRSKAAQSESFAPNAFRIGSDGQIILTVPYVEMGQGTYTSIPMLSSRAAVRSQLGRRARLRFLSVDRC